MSSDVHLQPDGPARTAPAPPPGNGNGADGPKHAVRTPGAGASSGDPGGPTADPGGPAGADTDPADGGPPPQPWWRRFLDLAVLAQVAMVVPVAGMLSHVTGASKTQWFDYWELFPASLNPNGDLGFRSLFGYHEGHILAVPRITYWVNYKLNGGLNTSLGLFVIGMVLVQVWLLHRLLPRRDRIGTWTFTAVFLAGVALLFSPQGIHNYARAMSGTAWLMANLFAIAAIFAASKTRWLEVGMAIAMPLALLATFSYGSGLMTWPVLVVICCLRRPRWGVVHTVVGSAAVAAIWLYFANYDRPNSQSNPELDLSDVGRRAAQVLGSVLTSNPDTAIVVGIIATAVAGFLAWQAVRVDRLAAAPWVGLGVYALLAAGMIGMARGGVNGDDIGVASRYFSLSALLLFALLVLGATGFVHDVRAAVAACVVGGLAFVSGQESVAHVEEWNRGQDELAIAMKLDLSRGYPFFGSSNRFVDDLERWGHYPFSDDFDLDCGRLGDKVEPDSRLADHRGARGGVDGRLTAYNRQTLRLEGWVGIPDTPVRCVLITDSSGVVVGAGVYGYERVDLVMAGGSPIDTYDIGFVVIAPEKPDTFELLIETEAGELVSMPDVIYSAGPRLNDADGDGIDDDEDQDIAVEAPAEGVGPVAGG